jgi:hypothetical protein
MSYGMEVYSPSGEKRVFNSVWFMSFHSNHAYVLEKNSTKTILIPDYIPENWGIIDIRIELHRWGWVQNLKLDRYPGKIVLRNLDEYYKATFNFKLLRG